MGFFNKLSYIVDSVIGTKILRNQKICKILTYYPKVKILDNDYERSIKAIMDYSPLSQPDVEDTYKLFMTSVYPVPKLPDPQTKQDGFITVTLTGGDLADNLSYRKVNLVVDIVFHLNSWITRDGYRPYLVAEEIDRMLNNQFVDEINQRQPTINKMVNIGFRQKDYSSYFYGVQIVYELQIPSNIDCGYLVPSITDEDTSESKFVPSFIPKNIIRNDSK